MTTPSIKRLAARLGIAALLFAQLAVAAYACPVMAAPGEMTPAAISDDMHAAMPHCEESDSGTTNLCMQHCQAGSQAVQTSPQTPLPAVAMLPFAVFELPLPVSSPGVVVLSTLPERETSPPPLLRFGFLRI